MSVSHWSSKVKSLQREIDKLNRDLAKVASDIASKTKRVNQIQSSISPRTTASTLKSKQRQIERLHDQISRLRQKDAKITKRIAEKTSKLFEAQQKLSSATSTEYESAIESLRRKQQQERNSLHHELAQLREVATSSPRNELLVGNDVDYDAFISHAHEDKDEIVRELVEALTERGLSIWYDEFELKVGDSLRRSIDKGLANSRFGIVVLSPSFFAKNWTQYELDGLVSKEMLGEKVILPIWHKVSKNEVMEYSPSLADKVALNTTTYTIEEIATELADTMRAP